MQSINTEDIHAQLEGISSSSYCMWGSHKVPYLNGDVDGNIDLLTAADAMGKATGKSQTYTRISEIRGEFVYQLLRKMNNLDEQSIKRLATKRRLDELLALWTQQEVETKSIDDPEYGEFKSYTFPFLDGDSKGRKDLLLAADVVDGSASKKTSYTELARLRGEFVYQLLKINNGIDADTARKLATVENTNELVGLWSQLVWTQDTEL